MSEIKIGKIISDHRKMKGVTQEELANHLGVSKPAVSKWESGQSYPDILLLPELAAYFNISVDDLIGYEPQMTKEEIRKLYRKIADDFAKGTFEKAYEECEEYLHKYYSCWELQYQIALLILNHLGQAGDAEKINQIIGKVLDILIRVEKSCDEVVLAKQALQMQALCYISLQQPAAAIDILENLNEPLMQSGTLLVRAYQMKGDKNKAIEHLQGYTYLNLMTILGAAPDYFQMYSDQPERMEQFYDIFIRLCNTFELDELHPAVMIQLCLAAAQVFVTQGNMELTFDALEQYVSLLGKSNRGNFSLHGSRIFDALDGYLSSIDVSTAMPRNSELIWQDLKNVIIQNPAFSSLYNEERFVEIKKRIEAM